MAAVYGDHPPWHDVQLMITGPAVGDVEATFRERWEDPERLSRSPIRWLGDRIRKDEPATVTPLPEQLPDPEPTGDHPVQLLRTYPNRAPGYAFAPAGERSVARGYDKVVRRASRLVYLEDQYLWSKHIARTFAGALRRNPEMRLIAVLPHYPDQDGRMSMPPNLIGRMEALAVLRQAGPGRVAFYGPENLDGVPVYVHAKICVIDDTWASVGSDNFNRRSWTHDSEVSAAVCHPEFARDLRLTLMAEHLGRDVSDLGPEEVFEAFERSAAALQAWHARGRSGSRPPGRLRPVHERDVSRLNRLWATPMYRTLYDPDGRPTTMKLRRRF
jgi:phosphatidylserine/phosphatidylglycerophosphate/cardiolipin synthase-like enzyme